MAEEIGELIAAQTIKVRAALNVGESSQRIAGTTGESAILQSLVTLHATEAIDNAVTGVSTRLSEVSGAIDLIGASVAELKAAADSFAETTRASEAQLARWTKVQAWASVALTFFTIVQIVMQSNRAKAWLLSITGL